MGAEIGNPSESRGEIRAELERLIPVDLAPADEAAWETLLGSLETGHVEDLLRILPTNELMDRALRMLDLKGWQFQTLTLALAFEVVAKSPLAAVPEEWSAGRKGSG